MEIENTLRFWAGQDQLEFNSNSVHANVLKKIKALGLPDVNRTIESGNKKGKVVTEYEISPELRLGIARELALEMGLLVPASSPTNWDEERWRKHWDDQRLAHQKRHKQKNPEQKLTEDFYNFSD